MSDGRSCTVEELDVVVDEAQERIAEIKFLDRVLLTPVCRESGVLELAITANVSEVFVELPEAPTAGDVRETIAKFFVDLAGHIRHGQTKEGGPA